MSLIGDLQSYLEDEGIAGGTTGWLLLRRRVVDAADQSMDQLVVLTEDGGPAPEIGAGEGIGDAAVMDLSIHVLVRAAAWDGDASAAKVAEIEAALHGKLDVLIGSTRCLRVAAQAPQPVFIGFDDLGRPRHTQSFRFLVAA